MITRACFAAVALLSVWGATSPVPPAPFVADPVLAWGERAFVGYGSTGIAARSLALPDTALEELDAGRFWHAARLLRAAGAAEGTPHEVLTLARAEAGWQNWPAVATLLEGEDWLVGVEDGLGLYLLGRSLEDGERWDSATDSYLAYAAGAGSRAYREAALSRSSRTAWAAGRLEDGYAALDALPQESVARNWAAVDLALQAAAAGEPASVRRLLRFAREDRARDALWRAEADGLLNGGDSLGAAASFQNLLEGASESRRPSLLGELGRLRMAAGDTVAAQTTLVAGLEEASGSERARIAASLHDIGGFDYTRTLQLARILDRAGDGARALRGYDRAHELAESTGEALPEASRLARARIMATVQSRHEEALEEFREIRETTQEARIGSRNLEVWARLRDRQGRSDAVRTLRRWLLEEYPSSSEAAEVAWSRGTNAEASGRLDEALTHYEFLVTNLDSHNRAGEARMRIGQIHLRRDQPAAAAEVFEQYVTDFPDGRRWQEASYWAGRTRLQLGDSAAGKVHLERVLMQPIEYYAVMAADLLEIPFAVDLPPGPVAEEPDWLTEGLVRLDILTESGLERGAADEIEHLRGRAGGSRVVSLRLAEALIERGRTIDGINLGWSILAEDQTWDQRLVRVTYPFPYEELVRREAAEWGVDVFMMAAIIRQESAFKADIVSHAGAVGLMQVMPPTGAQLARAHGPDGFTRESLTKPEVNLHLGAAYFVDMSRRYDGDLPLVLSAYNAGPTRATRWRRYPEVSDPLRFTERIPFVETRGYVKSVRRNLGLYRALYGQD